MNITDDGSKPDLRAGPMSHPEPQSNFFVRVMRATATRARSEPPDQAKAGKAIHRQDKLRDVHKYLLLRRISLVLMAGQGWGILVFIALVWLDGSLTSTINISVPYSLPLPSGSWLFLILAAFFNLLFIILNLIFFRYYYPPQGLAQESDKKGKAAGVSAGAGVGVIAGLVAVGVVFVVLGLVVPDWTRPQLSQSSLFSTFFGQNIAHLALLFAPAEMGAFLEKLKSVS